MCSTWYDVTVQKADILQLCNVMLLVDWLQLSDFLLFEHTKEWHSILHWMTIAADISFVTFSHNVGGENS